MSDSSHERRGLLRPNVSFQVTEDERQLLLMALASLVVKYPNFDLALSTLAMKFDIVENGRPVKYYKLKAMYENSRNL